MVNFFRQFPYPGRFIIFGQDGENFVAIYGATGRSESSLNRKFVQKGNQINMVQVIGEGNSELLSYPAFKFGENQIFVANGRQIEKLVALRSLTAQEQLSSDLKNETYEPDSNKTPRITGLYAETTSGATAGLHIIRSNGNESQLSIWGIPLIVGEGKYIATYSGIDTNPAPSFTGGPLSIPINFGSALNAAQTIFDALAPSVYSQDYRVGVIACYKKLGSQPEVAILNKQLESV